MKELLKLSVLAIIMFTAAATPAYASSTIFESDTSSQTLGAVDSTTADAINTTIDPGTTYPETNIVFRVFVVALLLITIAGSIWLVLTFWSRVRKRARPDNRNNP